MLKYLKPKNYIKKFQDLLINLNLKFNKNFSQTTHCLNQQIHFYLDTPKEYLLRLKSSYTGEPTTIYWIDKIIKPDDLVFDIGANVGAYSLLIAKIMETNQGKGQVFAFEPEAGNYYKLNRNIQLNQLSRYVTPLCLAFGQKHCIENFYLQSTELGSACHGLGEPKSEGEVFVPKHIQGMVSYSLDMFLNLEGTSLPSHIKIDVDGLEKQIVENGLKFLQNQSITSLIIEINESLSSGEVEKLLNSVGFVEVQRDSWKNQEGINIYNILYVKPGKFS